MMNALASRWRNGAGSQGASKARTNENCPRCGAQIIPSGYRFHRLHSPLFAGPSCCPYSCWLAGEPNSRLSGKGIEFWTA